MTPNPTNPLAQPRHRRSTRRLVLLVVPLAAVALAACGSKSSSTTTTASAAAPATSATTAAPANGYGPAPTTTSAPAAGLSLSLATRSLGTILVDGSGRTVYRFLNDTDTVSTCLGGCVSNWPPVISATAPTLGAGLNAADFGTSARPDGTVQVTFHGHPLYTFGGDNQAGDVNGEGYSSVWWVIGADGNPIKN